VHRKRRFSNLVHLCSIKKEKNLSSFIVFSQSLLGIVVFLTSFLLSLIVFIVMQRHLSSRIALAGDRPKKE
jgi:hypothetical protein